jgi:bis(5'-nucleosyl)-tetraphosphatase (symmetrical)
MALYAIGDVQGCDDELGALLGKLAFSAQRDRVWFVGDLVNRGPQSLAVLRRIRSLGAAAAVALGNHDLHLLAVALGGARIRGGDTLEELLSAPDRDDLLDWLISRPLMLEDAALKLVLLHAGLPPQWDLATARVCARELEQALTRNPVHLLRHLYGDKPDRWDSSLAGDERLRFIANCFTRLRYVDSDGRLRLKEKGAPDQRPAGKKPGNTHAVAPPAGFIPWFEAENARWRGSRIVFGHWSTLGYFSNADVTGLDTGCVWGGSLTALRVDVPDAQPVFVACRRS